jgi:phage antirepressor YoqD-like protein
LPTTFSEALRELASEVEKREESERVAEALRVAREADAPKVEFVDNYVGLKGTSSLSDVGRMLGFSDPKAFCALLGPVPRSMAISATSLFPRDVRK